MLGPGSEDVFESFVFGSTRELKKLTDKKTGLPFETVAHAVMVAPQVCFVVVLQVEDLVTYVALVLSCEVYVALLNADVDLRSYFTLRSE